MEIGERIMSKMCPSCGNTLDDNQKFCSVCGQSVPTVPAQPVETATMPTAQPQANVCPKCGTTNAPGTKFCMACGFNFATKPEVPQQPQQPAYQQPQPFQQPQQPTYQQPQQFQQPQQPAYQQPQPFQQNQMPAPKKSSTGMIVAIILIAVLVIGGAIAGILLMTRDNDEDKDDSSSKKSSAVTSSKEDSSDEDSSDEDSSKEDSSEESSEVVKPSTNVNDIDEYGIFTTSKFKRGYQLPIAQMMYGVQADNYDEFIEAYPECVKTYYDKKLATDAQKKTFIDNIYKKYVASYGEGFKINCETISETTYSTSLAESYCKKYGGDENVEEAYRVSFKIIVSNNGKSASTTSSIRCFKIDGEWYVFE